MADKLTPQQALAVTDRGGKLLVSAAAGSGKTKVLVDRLLGYLTDPMDPANLDDFLIITYTKAAASELRGKIAAKMTERIAQEPENMHLQKQMQRLFLTKISTVHGFCGDLIREYAYRLEVAADFRVADENECRELRDTVLKELLDRSYETTGENPDFRAFVDTQGLGRDDRLVPQIIEKVYDSAKCHLDPEGWLEECLQNADVADVADVSETVWGKYLIVDLFDYLDAQITVLHKCVQAAEACAGFEKAAVNLRDTLYQLQKLRSCNTWDDIVKAKAIDYGRLSFPRKNPAPEVSDRIKAVRNACKKGLEKKLHSFTDSSEQVLRDLRQSATGVRGLVQLVRQFDRDFQTVKQSRRVLDFTDLEHKTLDLLCGKSRGGPTAAAAEIGKRYREIMVDEYQDSNAVQDAIFDALTRRKQNCFMVGDVKQSIYQFRLADPGIFLQKYHAYLPAEQAKPGQGRKVLLSHNFRSGGEVIEAVNQVFGSCMTTQVGGLDYGEAEALREGIEHQPLPDGAVELYGLEVREDTYAEEADFVARKIRDMLNNGTPVRKNGQFSPVKPEDIVILLRSPGSVGAHFQRALEQQGIRCSSGGGMDLLQTQEVATLRAFLQTIVNPRLDIPLLSVLASPVFGFTADDLAAFRSRSRQGSIYDALLQSDLPKAVEFRRVLDILRREARMSTLTQLLERVFTLTRLDSIYGAMDGGKVKSTNLQTFYQLAVDFEKGTLRDLGQFLDHLSVLEGRGLLAAAGSNAGCVTLMSIHKSKGLEFPVVFLCGLSRVFNRESTQAQILCDKTLGLGLSVADPANRVRYPSVAKRAIAVKMTSQMLSEEMRVLYVAMTRARDRLIMTYAVKNIQADLEDIALRGDFDNGSLLCRDAVAPGEWVLLEAMGHREAGAFHALGGRPEQTCLGTYPWKIALVEAPEAAAESAPVLQEQRQSMPENSVELLGKSLGFVYAHQAATQAPSKQTATGRKGRIKDAEAAEDAQEPKYTPRTWHTPSFAAGPVDGRVYGNAIHNAMQYIRYENCATEEAVRQEIRYLIQQRFLTEEQGNMVDCGKIAAFFATPIGKQLRCGAACLREFKFSILDSGENYGAGLEKEQVLLQGVVDCAILEEDGITVLDFKTDFVTEQTLPQRARVYAPQVQIYAQALSRIYEMPVKAKLLYFFAMDRFVEV